MIAGQLLNALMLGCTYALVAMGYTLVFGILNMLNFAHPNVFAMGGFIVFSMLATFALPFPLAVLGVIAGGALLGYVTELLCFRPASKRADELGPAIASVAFTLVLSDVVSKIWGSEPVRLPAISWVAQLDLGPVHMSNIQLLILLFSVALMFGVDLMLRHTKAGYAVRAVAERRDTSQLLGVNVQLTITLVFVIAGILAALAGMLLALRLGLADPNIALSYGLRALAVMVIGGLGNVRGAMIAGLLVGFVDVMTLAFLSEAYSGVAAWVLLIMVLLIKPSGLAGVAGRRAEI